MPTPPSMTKKNSHFGKKFRKDLASSFLKHWKAEGLFIPNGTTHGKLMLPSCRQYPHAESILPFSHAANDNDDDNEKASLFQATVKQIISGVSQKEAKMKLQMMSSNPGHYMKVSGMPKDCLLAFLDDMKHIISDEYVPLASDDALHAVGETRPTPSLRQPDLCEFEKRVNAMMFEISTTDAKNKCYTMLRDIKRYSKMSGMPEESLKAFVQGLLCDFC